MTAYNMPILPEDMAVPEGSSQNGNVPPNATPTPMAQYHLKELPLVFIGRGEVRGFEFKQIRKSDLGYIYEVRQSELPAYYEVFRRVENLQYNCISYPGSPSFGITAWTCRTLQEAMARQNNLIEKQLQINKL